MSARPGGPAVAHRLQLSSFLRKPFEIDALVTAMHADVARFRK